MMMKQALASWHSLITDWWLTSNDLLALIRCRTLRVMPTNQRWADIDFFTPDPYPKKFLHIHIQSLSENFWNLVSDIHPYPIAMLAKYAKNMQ